MKRFTGIAHRYASELPTVIGLEAPLSSSLRDLAAALPAVGVVRLGEATFSVPHCNCNLWPEMYRPNVVTVALHTHESQQAVISHWVRFATEATGKRKSHWSGDEWLGVGSDHVAASESCAVCSVELAAGMSLRSRNPLRAMPINLPTATNGA